MSDDSTAEKATGPFAIPVDLGDYSIDEAYERGVRGGIASRDAEVAELRGQLAERVRVHATDVAVWDGIAAEYQREIRAVRKSLAEAQATIERHGKALDLLNDLDLDHSQVTAPGTAWGSILRESIDILSAPSSMPEMPEWDDLIMAERGRQIAKGYDDAHDAEHGPDHLIVWAIEYIRRGERVKAAAILHSLRSLLSAPSSTGDNRG